ncbi:hypothetical protein ACI2JA_08670 [Alkalihalobacillus sp. NPDC078783]
MFKGLVIAVHSLYFLAIMSIMVGAQLSVAAPDIERNDGLLYALVMVVMLFIGFSCWLNLKVRKIWIFILSVVVIPLLFQYAIHLSLVFGY